jgi:pilus assembly protein FimV
LLTVLFALTFYINQGMNMKRFLLTLVCCSPLVFSSPSSFSLVLTGPSGEQALSYEQYGPITSIETLWGISTKFRPDNSVSIQQTMVAVYKLNPYAFYQGNINKLIPESLISVPSLEFIKGQTNKEAAALIAKYSPPQKTPLTKSKIKSQPAVEPTVTIPQEPITKNNQAEVDQLNADNLAGKKELIVAENRSAALQNELNIVNEQFLVATETNQSLKLKLQPLQDELSALKSESDASLLINQQLQETIDDYRAQLDAVEARPFSGGGLLNELLRLITSSLTNLLITIFSPLLLLVAVFVVITRIRSKRLFAEQEKELAESTAILMEQAGQFDALLTDDNSQELEEELDFTDDAELDSVDADQQPPKARDNDEAITLEDEIESIDLSDSADNDFDVVDLTDEDDSQTTEDDPFGIGALVAQEDLISSTDLDDTESQTDEDDPFGIGALVEEGDISLTENKPQAISEAEQADLDLAAEWESQLAAEEEVKQNDVVEKEESNEDSTAASFDIDAFIDETENSLPADDELATDEVEETPDSDLTAPEAAYVEQIKADDLSGSAATEDALSEFEIADSDEVISGGANESEPVTDDTDQAVVELDENQPFDASALDNLTEDQVANEPASEDINDSFAKQLSDVAFNEDAPLPKVDSKQKNDFIAIETLLEDSDDVSKNEPYAELDLDLDFDDFPDVVNAGEEVDIDDDDIGTQLDLARAYLEIDDKVGAKEILLSIIDISNGEQRSEIDKLLIRLK